jgi:Uma2 family endonuclease
MASVITPTAYKLITGEEFALMDVPEYYELVRGRIVPMPPPNHGHGKVEFNIAGPVFVFLQSNPLGHMAIGDSGVYTERDPDTVRGTDLNFTSNERLAKRDPSKAYLDVAPDWITEILSPSNTKTQVDDKLEEYFAIKVRTVWLVDPEERCVHVYRSLTDVKILHEADTITGEDVLPGFEIQVARFFENI